MKDFNAIFRAVDDAGGRVIDAGDDGLAFVLGEALTVIVSNGLDWDHVSVSRADRVPSYEEMTAIKKLCFRPDEWAVEYHAPARSHVNVHPNCLHLWRPQRVRLPTPPQVLV